MSAITTTEAVAETGTTEPASAYSVVSRDIGNGYMVQVLPSAAPGIRVKPLGLGAVGIGTPWGVRGVDPLHPFARAVAAGLRDGKLLRTAPGVLIPYGALDMFTDTTGRLGGLPPLCPFPFRLRHVRKDSEGSVIDIEVRGADGRRTALDGMLVRHRDGTASRVGQAMGAVLGVVARSNEAPPAKRQSNLAELRKLVDPGLVEAMLAGTAIDLLQAGALGIEAVRSDADLRVAPVLFGRMPSSDRDGPLLNAAQHEAFLASLDFGDGDHPCLRIGPSSGVVMDDSVRKAVASMRPLRRGAVLDRVTFLEDPDAHLAAAGAGNVPLVASGPYAPHVKGIGIWIPPSFEYIKRQKNAWIPEDFVVTLAGSAVMVSSEEAARFYQAILLAERGDKSMVSLAGREVSLALARQAWMQIEAQTAVQRQKVATQEGEMRLTSRLTLIAQDNFECVNHVARPRPRTEPEGAPDALAGLVTPPVRHQIDGIGWLVSRWREGAPSALLADEMGLGKTLQLLAFLSWMHASGATRGKPMLVVIPATLLDLWADQSREHLRPGLLPEPFAATAANLRASGPEDDLGKRVEVFSRSPWTIVTYETLKDNAMLFGAVHWAAVVLDEIQKVKDPGTLVRNAVCSLNADFAVGSSGTVIENGIEDLWSIVDAIHAGRLGDLRSFSRDHAGLDIERLRSLRDDLMMADPFLGSGSSAFMLRRFKDDVLEGLPPKLVLTHRETMPKVQAEVYLEALTDAKKAMALGTPAAALRLVQDIRRISLHPDAAGEVDVRSIKSVRAWAVRSARITTMFDILSDVRQRGESALIFLDDLAMQVVVAEAIKMRFSLAEAPQIISGDTASRKRMGIANHFQNGQGFDVLIMSRVGGLGLTLTRARHVIHVGRWWNPAVEDQFNDRVHRMGQRHDVTVHVPIAVHPDEQVPSFDLLLDDMLQRKREIGREVLIPPVTGVEHEELLRTLTV